MRLGSIFLIPVGFFGVVGGLATTFNIATSDWHYSDGNRVGYVDKFSYKGLFDSTKTHEGQMSMQNFVSDGNGGMTNTFEFSVRKDADDIIAKVSAARDSRHCVKLHYDQTVGHKFWVQGTDYRVTDVTDLGPSCGGNGGPFSGPSQAQP